MCRLVVILLFALGVFTFEQGDKSALDSIEESSIAGVTVICYYSQQSNFCAMQAFAYEEFVYKAITSLKITQ